ncbi:hypothetical protein [Streptomyces sp. ISL-99]|nr:hypothetical protein [Streptomyces sp. ISL-99]
MTGSRLGQIALVVVPAFLSEQEAVDKVAARRYALTGDRRAL